MRRFSTPLDFAEAQSAVEAERAQVRSPQAQMHARYSPDAQCRQERFHQLPTQALTLGARQQIDVQVSGILRQQARRFTLHRPVKTPDEPAGSIELVSAILRQRVALPQQREPVGLEPVLVSGRSTPVPDVTAGPPSVCAAAEQLQT